MENASGYLLSVSGLLILFWMLWLLLLLEIITDVLSQRYIFTLSEVKWGGTYWILEDFARYILEFLMGIFIKIFVIDCRDSALRLIIDRAFNNAILFCWDISGSSGLLILLLKLFLLQQFRLLLLLLLIINLLLQTHHLLCLINHWILILPT